MAHAGAYTITLSNNKAEKEAVAFLLAADRRFLAPDLTSRKMLLDKLGLDRHFGRAFDLLILNKPAANLESLDLKDLQAITFVELKTTKKKLPENPKGFFFGATENEFALARQLGDRYKFCFVSLHSESKSFVMLTLQELEKRIRTKRVQYQINL